MKKRISQLMNNIIEKIPFENFQFVGIDDAGSLYEIQYRFKIKLKHGDENFCILSLKSNIHEINDEELIGVLIHELAHFFSPKSTFDEKKFMLFSELIRQTDVHKKIGGSRYFKKLRAKRDFLFKELGGIEGLNKATEKYQKEEDATDLRAINWGFEKQISAMREKSKTFDFWFRFVREDDAA